jgi:hypothetical protein
MLRAEQKSAGKLGVQYDFGWTGRENRRFASVALKAAFHFAKKTSIVLVMLKLATFKAR